LSRQLYCAVARVTNRPHPPNSSTDGIDAQPKLLALSQERPLLLSDTPGTRSRRPGTMANAANGHPSHGIFRTKAYVNHIVCSRKGADG
jgi:hypothetical protein